MDKNSLSMLKILIKNSEKIKLKNDKEIYDSFFKSKYDYDTYQDIIYNLFDKKLLYGFKADCMLNNLEINKIETDNFFVERRKYLIDKRIMPIITSLLMPIIVSFITALITTFMITK